MALDHPRLAVIVEDDPDVRNLLRTVLTQSGFETILTSNGEDGVEAVRRYEPILTTLDVSMPGMDGVAAAARIREFSSTYILMITAQAEEIDVIQGLDAGADEYLVKPFRPRELRARIESLLRRPRSIQPADKPHRPERTHTEPAPGAVWRRPETTGYGEQTPAPSGQGWGEPQARSPRPAPPEPPAPPYERPRYQQPAPPAPPAYEPPPAYPRPAAYEPPPSYEPPTPYERPRAYEPPPSYERPPAHQQPPAYDQAPRPAPQPPAQPAPAPYAAPPEHAAGPAEPRPHYEEPAAYASVSAEAGVSSAGADGRYSHRGLVLDPTTGLVTADGHTVALDPTEVQLLKVLMSSGRRVRSKADLVLSARGESYVTTYFVREGDKREIDLQIDELRRKLGDANEPHRWIETVKGVGYRMTI